MVNDWGNISQLIFELEKFLGKYLMPNVWISSSALAEKANEGLDQYKPPDLLEVMTNNEQVQEIISNPKKMYLGPHGFVLAAVRIQTEWRYYRTYRNFKQLKYLMDRATFIQRKYRLFQIKNNTKKKLKNLREDQMDAWKHMQKEFKKIWPWTKHEKRIEIHINSFGYQEF